MIEMRYKKLQYAVVVIYNIIIMYPYIDWADSV